MLKLLRKASQSLSCESEDSLKSSNTKALRPAILLSRSDPKRATDKQEYDGKDAAMPLGIVHANGSAAQDTRKEPLVHFTLVLDVSATMRGDPLKAVARGIRQLLKHLQPWDSLTICTFSSKVSPPVQCEVSSFLGTLSRLARIMKAEEENDAVLLFDAIEQAAEDLEARGARPKVVKPLLVFTDYHKNLGKADAHDANRALLWCNVLNLHPLLISCGDARTFLDVRSVTTREIFVGATDDTSIKEAFQVAGEWLQNIMRVAGIPDPAVDSEHEEV